jgi:hypothetical protein
MNYVTSRTVAHTFHPRPSFHFTSLHFFFTFTTFLFHTLRLLYHFPKPLPKITRFTAEFIASRTDTHTSLRPSLNSTSQHINPSRHTPFNPLHPTSLHFMIIFTTLLFHSLHLFYHFPNRLPKVTWFTGQIPDSVCK